MRKLMVFAVAAWMVVPAGAARRLTVAQLAETLSTAIAQHRSDEDIARQVGAVELTERLTATTLDRFAAKMALQPRTALALQLLADQSAFVNPPAGEELAAAPPDSADQEKMLAAARAYAVQTWGRLPNFFVSRVTTRFDNTAQVQHAGEFAVRLGLHPVNKTTRQITFREGKEVLDAEAATNAGSSPAMAGDEMGLRSWGEFGPALTVVLADLASRKVTFSHWEQTPGGLAAVYRYDVPREASHYLVTYSYFDVKARGRTEFGYSGRQRSAQQVANIPKAPELESFRETPGYHGTIAIDPASGAVLRITIEAGLSSGDPLLSAATMIEYAPVTIGDRKFICPARSLAISRAPSGMSGCGARGESTASGVGDLTAWQSATSRCDNSPVLLINETSFTNYHRLGSTARIVSDTRDPGLRGETSSAHSKGSAAAAPGETPEASAGEGAKESTAAQPGPEDLSGAQPGKAADAAPPPVAPAAPADPVIAEISMTAANGVPDAPLNQPPPSDSGFSIKVITRLVDVGVIAFDKKGRPATDLTAKDFEVYDNGRKQEIRFFTPARVSVAAPSALTAPTENSDRTFSNRVPDAMSEPGSHSATDTGVTILLIDETHVAWSDLSYARDQMVKFVAALAAPERVGLYSMTGSGFRVSMEATGDHAALAARLKTFTPSALSLAQAGETEKRNRQQIDEVHKPNDLNAVNGNHADTPDAEQSIDPQLLTMGDNPARASLMILTQVARHLAAMPGHKNLVWVSSDNVFGDWQDQQVGIDKSPKDSQAFAVRVQEAMNDAHTAVYPFDVSQLEGGAIAADIQHRNVELTQSATDNAATAGSAGGPAQGGGGRNMQPGRIMAQMSQDLHPIQGTIREIAAATGGRTIRRTGELAPALGSIVEDGHAICQLSFSPQGTADGAYHAITVKLTGRRGLTLRYRTGYVFAKEPASLRERFQAAVWRPVDSGEIGVTAEVVPSGARAQIKLNIAATDLGMQEQAGRWMDKLDIFFIQRDDAGLHAQVEGQTLGLRLKSSTYQNLLPRGVPFERAIELRAGMGSLRVVVVDENSGRIGSVTIPSAAVRANP